VVQTTGRRPEMARKKKPEYACWPRCEMHILGIALNEGDARSLRVLRTLSGSQVIVTGANASVKLALQPSANPNG
jgi:hypothetical protein